MTEDKKRRRAPPGFNIGAEISRARERAGISRSELNQRTNISRTVLIGYEEGRTIPGAREIRLICDALQITPNRLLYSKENPFDVPDGPWSDLVQTEDKKAIRLISFFKMLANEERAAILTLVHSILEGRHGKPKLDELVEVLKAMEDSMGDIMGRVGPAVEQEFTPALREKMKADLERKLPQLKADHPKRARAKKG